MNKELYYSKDLSKLVSWAFLSPEEYREKYPPKTKKVDLSLCTIIHNEFGFFYLYIGDRKIKQITSRQFEEYKSYVKNFIDKAVQ